MAAEIATVTATHHHYHHHHHLIIRLFPNH
jgi:hypothetical protein